MNIEEQLKEMNNTLNLIGRNVASLHEKVDGHGEQLKSINTTLESVPTQQDLQRAKLEFIDTLSLTKNELLDKLATKEDMRGHEHRIKALEVQAH